MDKLSSVLENLSDWPWAVAFSVCFIFWIFREPIGRWIGGISAIKLKSFGIEARPSPQQKSAAEEIQRDFGSAVLASCEKQIQSDLDGRSFKDDLKEREKYLIRRLADISLAYEFDRAYWLIWGSQIMALQFLNSSGFPGFVSLESMKRIFSEKATELKGIKFEQWWVFLQDDCGFAVIKENSAYITPLGREFLTYITAKGYNMNKYG